MHVPNRASPVATFTVDARNGRVLGGARLPPFPRHTHPQVIAIARASPKISDWLSRYGKTTTIVDEDAGAQRSPCTSTRAATARSRRPWSTTRPAPCLGVDGPAGRLDDGPRLRLRVRATHQRPVDLARACAPCSWSGWSTSAGCSRGAASTCWCCSPSRSRSRTSTRGSCSGPVPLVYPPLVYLLCRLTFIGVRSERRAGVRRQPAAVGAGRRGDLPDRLPRRARPLRLERHRRRLRGRRRGRPPDQRRHAVRDVPRPHRRAMRDPLRRRHFVAYQQPQRGTAARARTSSATPTGPVNYAAYVPAVAVTGWTGLWDDLPSAHATSVMFDALCALGLLFAGRRLGGWRLGRGARVRLGGLPVHRVRAASRTRTT